MPPQRSTPSSIRFSLWGVDQVVGDRSITFLFVAVWVGVGSVWIILDWLSNPNRGAFRPVGRHTPRNLRTRWADRRRRRAQEDAAVRSTLRERYGRSSLRLFWSNRREEIAQAADSDLVTDPLMAAERPEPELHYEPLLFDADLDPEAGPTPEPEPETEPEIDPTTIRGWRVGVHPLALTRAGKTPTAATIRSRVWKNLADISSDIDTNTTQRLMAGKPPKRLNPSTGKTETAKVDLASALPYWPGETTDEFSLL